MSHLEWDDRYSLGSAALDTERREVIALINVLADAIAAGQPNRDLCPMLGRLVTASRAHFANEEAEMRRHSYPGMSRHTREHFALARQAQDLLTRAETGGELPPGSALDLSDRLGRHLQVMDAEFCAFVRLADQAHPPLAQTA